MTTHTPGPWMEGPTDGIGQRGKLIVVDATGHKIADCEAEKVPGSIAFTRSLEEDHANVRLIIAAPKLLAELSSLTERFERCLITTGTDPAFAADAVKAARTVIAEAEGAS